VTSFLSLGEVSLCTKVASAKVNKVGKETSYLIILSVAILQNFFFLQFVQWRDKLERLALANISNTAKGLFSCESDFVLG
jgi:hypothetical protein